MTARSRSLERMVRRYVLDCDGRKLDAKGVLDGGPGEPTGSRRLAALPGWSGGRHGPELRPNDQRLALGTDMGKASVKHKTRRIA